MKFIEIKDNYLNDMALSRTDAIDRCISLGKNFIEHFDKIYNNPDSEAFNHWAKEMKGWLNQVKEIKLKPKNNYILKGQLRDWFFTAGAVPEDFMLNPTDKEIQMYDNFCEELLSGKDIYEVLNELFKSNIRDTEENKYYLTFNNRNSWKGNYDEAWELVNNMFNHIPTKTEVNSYLEKVFNKIIKLTRNSLLKNKNGYKYDVDKFGNLTIEYEFYSIKLYDMNDKFIKTYEPTSFKTVIKGEQNYEIY